MLMLVDPTASFSGVGVDACCLIGSCIVANPDANDMNITSRNRYMANM
jgi:hypothetical protein